MSIFRGFGTHPSKYVSSRAGFWRGRHVWTLCVYACVWLVLPAIATAQSVDTRNSSEVELEQAVALALDHSLELASIRARSNAIRAASSYAGALPDPTLSLNAMNMPTDSVQFRSGAYDTNAGSAEPEFSVPGKAKASA